MLFAIFSLFKLVEKGMCGNRVTHNKSGKVKMVHSKSTPRRTQNAGFVLSISFTFGWGFVTNLEGPMVTADVSCSACNSIIGWKFVSDMQKDQPNIHFVNRYGICCSSFRERPEKCRSRSTASCESSSTGEETEGSFVVTDTVNDPHVNEQGSDTDASSDSDASVFTYVNWA